MKILSILASLVTVSVAWAAAPGAVAPEFSLTDAQGKTASLSDYKGRTVVLEWVNFDCPFVKKHYGTGNMQALQKEAASKEVVWLSVASSARGKQGHFEGKALLDRIAKEKWAGERYLVDVDGKVGRAYGARTTPQMVVIAPDGKIAYAGAIDHRPTTDAADVKDAKNHVRRVLEDLAAGAPIDPASTNPYGCSVKY